MTTKIKLLTFLLIPLALSGCIARETADEKLAKGCEAAISAFLTEGFTLKVTKKKSFQDHPELGYGHRVVKLDTVINDGWANIDKTYECTFAENIGIGMISHKADIYQLKMDDRIIGEKDGKISGTIEEIDKLNRAANPHTQ